MKTNLASIQWFEELPESCPPSDALDCNGVFYRIANANPADISDFFSQRMLYPSRTFRDVDECTARSLSLFDTKEAAELRLKLPKFRNAHIAEVTLTATDCKIKKTFGPQHYSWWRTTSFDITNTTIIL